MFAKLSLMSFIYKMLEAFCFPDKKIQEIYGKYLIEKVHIYHVLTHTIALVYNFFSLATQKVTFVNKNIGK